MDVKKFVVPLAIVGTIGFFVIGFIGSVFSFRADAVRMEEVIIAQYEQNQNNYDNMWKRFKEVAQVSEMYSDDVRPARDEGLRISPRHARASDLGVLVPVHPRDRWSDRAHRLLLAS